METINILVVDDDREIVNAICKLLESEGYKTLKAYDGLDAIDILNQNTVHLIILDIMMPNQDGLTTTMKIRNEKTFLLYCCQQRRRKVILFSVFQWVRMIIYQNRMLRQSFWQG